MEKDFENLFKKEEIESLENETMEHDKTPSQKIRHLVLSGGSIWGLKTYGALRYAYSNGFLQIDLLESIYATSVGAMLAVMIALKYDFAVVDSYIINRPWHQTWMISPDHILNIPTNLGLYTRTFMQEFFSPFFRSLNLSIDITLQEFYDYTHIDLHIYTTELNTFTWVDLSHTSHPTWKLIDAVYASCCIPVAFSPLMIDGGCYIDGGIHMNYPLTRCVESHSNMNEIFGILLPPVISQSQEEGGPHSVINETSDTSFMDYISCLLNKLMEDRLFLNDVSYRIPYQLDIDSEKFSVEFLNRVLTNPEERKRLIESGSNQMRSWLDR